MDDFRLDIKTNSSFYNEDLIVDGAYIKKVFNNLSSYIFLHSYIYFKNYNKDLGEIFVPILEKERNFGSTVACAINQITPVHLSEWTFPQAKRRVDFWFQTFNKGEVHNFFLEAKQGWQHIGKKLYAGTQHSLEDLVEQVISIKKDIAPHWSDHDTFFGIMLIPSGVFKNKENSSKFKQIELLQEVRNNIDQRSGIQLLISTWMLPEEIVKAIQKSSWNWICSAVSVVGLVLTKKLKK